MGPMQLVDVNTEDYGIGLAKIVENLENGNFMIKYLSPYKDSEKLYKYEKDIYEIEPEMISCFHETEDEADVGYTQVERNLFERDSDSDYDPDTDEESSSDEEECVNSDEEFVDAD
jgi:hypothetical protein